MSKTRRLGDGYRWRDGGMDTGGGMEGWIQVEGWRDGYRWRDGGMDGKKWMLGQGGWDGDIGEMITIDTDKPNGERIALWSQHEILIH